MSVRHRVRISFWEWKPRFRQHRMSVHHRVRISFWECKTLVSPTENECAQWGLHLVLGMQNLAFANHQEMSVHCMVRICSGNINLSFPKLPCKARRAWMAQTSCVRIVMASLANHNPLSVVGRGGGRPCRAWGEGDVENARLASSSFRVLFLHIKHEGHRKWGEWLVEPPDTMCDKVTPLKGVLMPRRGAPASVVGSWPSLMRCLLGEPLYNVCQLIVTSAICSVGETRHTQLSR